MFDRIYFRPLLSLDYNQSRQYCKCSCPHPALDIIPESFIVRVCKQTSERWSGQKIKEIFRSEPSHFQPLDRKH